MCLIGLCCVACDAEGRAGEPRYVIGPSDVLTIRYLYTPEYDSTAVVQPDGYISAPIVGDLHVGGRTLAEARDVIIGAAAKRLREPEVFVDLKEFDKPHFIVGGEVGAPGRFELRSPTTVLQAIAMAGGFKSSAKHSQVLLLRQHDAEHAEAILVDAKRLARATDPDPEIVLVSGDMLFVPQNTISKIERIVRWTSIGMFVNVLNPLNR
jgi:polysaccharide export outer membrane protein